MNSNFNNRLYSILILLSIISGAYTGYSFIKYAPLAKGIIGITTLVLIHFLFYPPSIFTVNNKNAEFPRDLKYIPIAFLLSIAAFISAAYIFDTLFYYINLMKY